MMRTVLLKLINYALDLAVKHAPEIADFLRQALDAMLAQKATVGEGCCDEKQMCLEQQSSDLLSALKHNLHLQECCEKN